MELKLLGRVCKLGLAGGRTGFSPVRHTMRLAEDPSNQLRSWTRAGPSHRSGSLQTRPSVASQGRGLTRRALSCRRTAQTLSPDSTPAPVLLFLPLDLPASRGVRATS